MHTVREIQTSGYRKVTLARDSSGLFYSQGGTQVHYCVIDRLTRFPQLNYRVCALADRINLQAYRQGRRHYEILEFIKLAFDAVKPLKGLAIRVMSTDGSSRCTAVNGIAHAYNMYDPRFGESLIPVAISFGAVDDELVYDLDYLQDSEGHGDCALLYHVKGSSVVIASILYEGVMPIDQFIQGLINSERYALAYVERCKE